MAQSGSSSSSKPAAKEHVVLLHGIYRSSKHMKRLENALVEAGYGVLNLDYPSTKRDLVGLTAFITEKIHENVPEGAKKVHFVGYSMGGLLVRAVLNAEKPDNLGRVVLLATPNKGSEVADFLKNFSLYRWLYGPAGQELVTDPDGEITKLLGEIDYKPGVIAGYRSIDPFSSLFLLPGLDDGKVSVESAKIDGMADFILLPTSHTFFPQSNRVIAQTLYFLKHGEFFHPAPERDAE